MKKQKIFISVGFAGMLLLGANSAQAAINPAILNAESINNNSVTYTTYEDFNSGLSFDANAILNTFGIEHDGNATMVNQSEYLNFRVNASKAEGVNGYKDSMVVEITYYLPGSIATGSFEKATFDLQINLDYQYSDVIASDASVTYTSYNDFASDLSFDANEILNKFGVAHEGNPTMINQNDYINFRVNASKAGAGYSDSMVVEISYYVPGALTTGSMQKDTFKLEINLNF